eukprot:CAMPEP_0118927386 /NCGR_PEP_ID=MMETSP1169-20130426/4870_1 /TAXON_ID=36882 /ORGANISM="Pyramimonas obovata, Strain CCMP722" /LENGTH=624 /DNA_ID=CAMNT_0006869133 /DNA_START=235 /DNA_END=2107 /DNA_ORIENTATION=+
MAESNRRLGGRIGDVVQTDEAEDMDTTESSTLVQRKPDSNEPTRSRGRSRASASKEIARQNASACSKIVTYRKGAVLSLQSSDTRYEKTAYTGPEHAVLARAYQLQDFVCYLGNGLSSFDRSHHKIRHSAAIEEAEGLGLLESPKSPPQGSPQFKSFTLPSTELGDNNDVADHFRPPLLSDSPEHISGDSSTTVMDEETRRDKLIPFTSDSSSDLLGVEYSPPRVRNHTVSAPSKNKYPSQSSEHAVTIHGSSCKSSYAFSGDLAGKGAFGEAWRGFAMDGHGTSVVLKRLFLQLGKKIIKDGMREVYFGQLITSAKLTQHLARYTAHFKDERTESFWVVYRDEGFSLYQCVFSVLPGPNPMMVPSALWEALRAEPDVIKELLKGVLTGLRNLHQLSVTHRDVKLENVFVQPSSRLENDESRPFINPSTARLGDFGSAVRTPMSRELAELFQEGGPGPGDETIRTVPPEALDASTPQDYLRPPSHDVWGVGIIWLELLLGTTDVWSRLACTAPAALVHRLRQQQDAHDTRCKGERFRDVMLGLKVLGFLHASDANHHHSHDTEALPKTRQEAGGQSEYTRRAFDALRAADANLGIGLDEDIYALDLLRLLLHPPPRPCAAGDDW